MILVDSLEIILLPLPLDDLLVPLLLRIRRDTDNHPEHSTFEGILHQWDCSLGNEPGSRALVNSFSDSGDSIPRSVPLLSIGGN